jgi:hypothetical protein
VSLGKITVINKLEIDPHQFVDCTTEAQITGDVMLEKRMAFWIKEPPVKGGNC